ncbi:hypothetical protein [Pseudobacteriovorax antillogorgiicola]|uniref:Uncharacterized protein n=1 Tax=Pseudobacteriovorax antillogorgiicola TaxID=1513793 RepID=A0A1Y6BYR0_9BACT|nr:hypothetical protein [Pseudobacteriovorax antillogorgiicola]TCS43364.1 hypothetical protein EDD56_1374 [Pseudobacteriovorax antillogorgiicola]SMF35127.1 hypothetical protein SAMN06296036_110204 [Pseudobacteriovorax antillogorgiicola]
MKPWKKLLGKKVTIDHRTMLEIARKIDRDLAIDDIDDQEIKSKKNGVDQAHLQDTQGSGR